MQDLRVATRDSWVSLGGAPQLRLSEHGTSPEHLVFRQEICRINYTSKNLYPPLMEQRARAAGGHV
jgi:hypothetical protein